MLPIRQHLLTLTCLKSTAKTVLVEVCELAENGKKGGCFASNATLSADLGMSLATVVRTVATLVEAGLLTSEVVKAEANRRYLRPTPRLRACYVGGTEAQQLAAAAELTIVKSAPKTELTIVKNDSDYSQNGSVTIVKNDSDYSQNASRVLGDDQYDQVDDQHDQRLTPSERAVFEKKIGDLQAEVLHLKARLALAKAPRLRAAPPPATATSTPTGPKTSRCPSSRPPSAPPGPPTPPTPPKSASPSAPSASRTPWPSSAASPPATCSVPCASSPTTSPSATAPSPMTMATNPLANLVAQALAAPAPAASAPCPPAATAETAGPPQLPSPPTLPPESPDEVPLTPAEAHQALAKAKVAKHGVLYRAHHTWQLLNCDLVPCDFDGGLGYVLRETSTTPEPYYPAKAEQVELTEEEVQAALAAGQLRKWGNLKADYHDYQAKHAPRQAAPTLAVNFENVRSWALRQGQAVANRRLPAFDFVLDDYNRRVFELLCYYFAGDREFVVLGQAWGFGTLSLDKGLGLFGGVGVGKTITLEAFRQNPRRPYGMVSAQKVSDVFKEDLLANDGKRSIVSPAQRFYCGQGQDGRPLCFDDVAREKPIQHQHMGNVVVPLQKVIMSRYDAVQRGRLPLWATHLTSNNPLEPTDDSKAAGVAALSELYGEPAADRLYELCNIIPLSGPSRRG